MRRIATKTAIGCLLAAITILLSACHSKSGHSSLQRDPDSFYLDSGFSYTVWAVAPAADGAGDIYVGGQFAFFNNYLVNGIVRLNANGSIDTGFDMGSGFNGTVLSIAPATDGSGDIYVAGSFTTYRGGTANHIIRLNADGSPDSGFATGDGFNDIVWAVREAQDGSGDVYAGGDFSSFDSNSSVRVARINSDGSFDAGFDVGAGASDVVTTLAVAGGGGGDLVYIGGDFNFVDANASPYIGRLQNDGSFDAGFNVGTGFDDAVETIALANDGSGDVYVGGRFLNFDSNASVRIARLNSDGSFDAAFATSTGFNSTVYDIAVDPGTPGQLYVGGAFSTFDGNTHNAIACLNSVGFICSGFNSGSGFDYVTLALAFTNDGSDDLLVGGAFLYYRALFEPRLVRLNSSGDAL